MSLKNRRRVKFTVLQCSNTRCPEEGWCDSPTRWHTHLPFVRKEPAEIDVFVGHVPTLLCKKRSMHLLNLWNPQNYTLTWKADGLKSLLMRKSMTMWLRVTACVWWEGEGRGGAAGAIKQGDWRRKEDFPPKDRWDCWGKMNGERRWRRDQELAVMGPHGALGIGGWL